MIREIKSTVAYLTQILLHPQLVAGFTSVLPLRLRFRCVTILLACNDCLTWTIALTRKSGSHRAYRVRRYRTWNRHTRNLREGRAAELQTIRKAPPAQRGGRNEVLS